MLKKDGEIEDQVMYNTFNMGIGMAVVVGPDEADQAIRIINETGERAYIIGEICDGKRGITLC
jgi:phosphoribosylformylglycinamidine cyclo-ligase